MLNLSDTGRAQWQCPFCRAQLNDAAIEQTTLGRSIEYWKVIANSRKEYIATGRACVICAKTNTALAKCWRLIQTEDLSPRQKVIAIGAQIMALDGLL